MVTVIRLLGPEQLQVPMSLTSILCCVAFWTIRLAQLEDAIAYSYKLCGMCQLVKLFWLTGILVTEQLALSRCIC